MAKTEYGLQLYSLRDITKESLKDALRQTAAMGYRYAEFAGFFGHGAEEVKEWLDTYGLICSSTHTGIDALKPDVIEETVRYHKTIGCPRLIVPGADWSTAEKAAENIALLNRAQKICADAGITLGYHNHSHEFLPTPYGLTVEDELLARTTLSLEIDTFWLFNAGIDPVPYLEAHKDRIDVIHLKDGIPTTPENRTFSTCFNGVQGRSVGEGEAPVKAVREWALKNNVLMVIESESLSPTGPEEAKRCIDFLRTLD